MKLTNKDKSILIGLLLGDGYINKNGRICIEHCILQKDYCIFKAKLLHSVCGGNDIIVHEYERDVLYKKDGKEYKKIKQTTISFKKQSASFKFIRELLYKNNKKTITKEVLELLDPLSIALWYMDDGCLTAKKNEGYDKVHYMLRLCTYLSKEENELIRLYFIDKYNMTWNVVKADGCKDGTLFMLRCGHKEGIKFMNIIKNIILEKVPSMTYKIFNI